jgi:two-component system, NarL family, nitrate/nitrite response regulator NarL
MSKEAMMHVIRQDAQPADPTVNIHRQGETILLCRNSLVAIGLKHLLQGTCFSITDTVADESSFTLHNPAAASLLFIIDGSDLSDRIIATAKNLKGRYPGARIAVIADSFDLSFVRPARGSGIDGFCLSASEREVLIKSLELVMLGETVLPTYIMALLLEATSPVRELEPHVQAGAELEASDPKLRRLSTREAEILHCLTEGAPNKMIARKLDVAEATVKVHIKAILRKIGATNRTQAAMWATNHLPASSGSSLRS